MKAIQITVDEALLSRLDADPEVKRVGRSEVFRRAAQQYLHGRRRRVIAEAYGRAYGSKTAGLGDDFAGWEAEGSWPEP